MFNSNTIQGFLETTGKAIESKKAGQEAAKEVLGIGINSDKPKGNTDGLEVQSQKNQQNIEEQANQNNKTANFLLSTLLFGGALSSLFGSRSRMGFCGNSTMMMGGCNNFMGNSMFMGSPDPYFFSGNPALGTPMPMFGHNIMGNGYYGNSCHSGSAGLGILSGVLAGAGTYFAIKGLSGNSTPQEKAAKKEQRSIAKEERQEKRAEAKALRQESRNDRLAIKMPFKMQKLEQQEQKRHEINPQKALRQESRNERLLIRTSSKIEKLDQKKELKQEKTQESRNDNFDIKMPLENQESQQAYKIQVLQEEIKNMIEDKDVNKNNVNNSDNNKSIELESTKNYSRQEKKETRKEIRNEKRKQAKIEDAKFLIDRRTRRQERKQKR